MNLTDIDQRIRAGHSHQARAKLQEIVRRRHQSMIDRESLPQLASLCRRSGWPEGGLLLLNPIVRPPAKVKRLAQSKEIAEYAQSLISIGLVQEGRDLIATSTKDSPELMMAEAMSYFSAWDYSAAIPSLTRYVQTPGLSSYARLIGEVNLGAALVIVRDPEAPAQLSRLREECRRSGHSLLLGNLFEITAQWHYWQGEWDAAEQALEQSDRLLSQHVNIDKLSLEKWKVILRMRRSGGTRALTQQLHSIVARALDLRHWETSRDCDFHLAVIREDRRLATAVYFGTPYVAFRQRLATHFGPSWPEEFGRNMGEPSRRPSRLHVIDGIEHQQNWKIGQIVQRLFALLTSDSYRPFTVPTLHAGLFPDQLYNPQSSPAVIHQALKRLRQWLRVVGIPLAIHESRGAFRLHAMAPVRIQIPRESSPDWRVTHDERRFREAFAARAFTRADVAFKLAISERAANLRLQELERTGVIQREGAGPRTCYRLNKKN